MGPRIRIETPEQWERERARGRGSFILRVGMLRYGLTLFLVLNLIAQLSPGETSPLPMQLLGSAIAALLAGWLFGAWMWRHYSNRFGPQQA